jgi:hypothetical protein
LLLKHKDPANGLIITRMSKLMPVSMERQRAPAGLQSAGQNDGFLMLASGASERVAGSNFQRMQGGLAPLAILVCAVGMGGRALAESAPHFIAYGGRAVESASGAFLYSEHHVLKYEKSHIAERIVLYRCADSSPFARKVARYVEPLAPDFVFEDSSNGVREGVSNEGGSRMVFFRGGFGMAEKQAPLKVGPTWVIDAGFDEFIHDNWQSLVEGRTLSLHFLVPSRLSGVNFQVQHIAIAPNSEVTESFRLKVAGLLGWVAPSIDVSYRADDHILLRYEGVSDLRDRSGENLRAAITFDPTDRRVSNAAEFAAAARAPLAPCRG